MSHTARAREQSTLRGSLRMALVVITHRYLMRSTSAASSGCGRVARADEAGAPPRAPLEGGPVSPPATFPPAPTERPVLGPAAETAALRLPECRRPRPSRCGLPDAAAGATPVFPVCPAVVEVGGGALPTSQPSPIQESSPPPPFPASPPSSCPSPASPAVLPCSPPLSLTDRSDKRSDRDSSSSSSSSASSRKSARFDGRPLCQPPLSWLVSSDPEWCTSDVAAVCASSLMETSDERTSKEEEEGPTPPARAPRPDAPLNSSPTSSRSPLCLPARDGVEVVDRPPAPSARRSGRPCLRARAARRACCLVSARAVHASCINSHAASWRKKRISAEGGRGQCVVRESDHRCNESYAGTHR